MKRVFNYVDNQTGKVLLRVNSIGEPPAIGDCFKYRKDLGYQGDGFTHYYQSEIKKGVVESKEYSYDYSLSVRDDNESDKVFKQEVTIYVDLEETSFPLEDESGFKID